MGKILKERFIYKLVWPYVHAVEIQTEDKRLKEAELHQVTCITVLFLANLSDLSRCAEVVSSASAACKRHRLHEAL